MAKNDAQKLQALISCFEYDEEQGEGIWTHKSDKALLEQVYSNIPLRFPSLFEQLLLNYRWVDVWLMDIRLVSSPPAANLQPFVDNFRQDEFLVQFCLDNGYLMFGHGLGGGYDPVCVQTRKGRKSEKNSIVMLDHEAILCNARIREVNVLAKNFFEFIADAISKSGGAV